MFVLIWFFVCCGFYYFVCLGFFGWLVVFLNLTIQLNKYKKLPHASSGKVQIFSFICWENHSSIVPMRPTVSSTGWDPSAGHYCTWLLHTYWRCLRSIHSKGGNSTCDGQNQWTPVCSAGMSLSQERSSHEPFLHVPSTCHDAFLLPQSPRPGAVQEAGEAGSNILLCQVQSEPTAQTNQTKVSPTRSGKSWDKVSSSISYTPSNNEILLEGERRVMLQTLWFPTSTQEEKGLPFKFC